MKVEFKKISKYHEKANVPEFLKDITESVYKERIANDTEVLSFPSFNNVRAEQNFALKLLADNPELETTIAMLRQHLEAENYDTLYILLRSDQLPLLFKAKLNNDKDMAVLKEYFNANALESTLQDLSNHIHLYNVAKFMVLPKYDLS